MSSFVDVPVRFIIAVLFNGLWEAALLALVAWIVVRATPRSNATTRYSVFAAALFASLILPIVTASIAATPLTQPFNLKTSAPAKAAHVAVALPRLPSPAPQEHAAPAAPRIKLTLPRVAAFLIVGFWLLGAAFVLARLIGSLLHLERLKRDALPLPVEYRARLKRWTAATKGSRGVRLCRSSEIVIPVAVGLFDAMILLPEHLLDELELEEVDRIVLHELAHLRRGDDWANAVARLSQALLFFNPGIFWLIAKLDLEREVACDDWVLQQSEALPYAACLAKIVETTILPYAAISAPGAFITRRSMSARIERLLTTHRDVRVRTSFAPAGIAIATLAALSIVAAFVSPSIAYTGITRPPVVRSTRTKPRPIAHQRILREIAHRPAPTIARISVASVRLPSARTPAQVSKPVPRISASVAILAVTPSAAPVPATTSSPDFVDELAGVGYTNLSIDQLVQLRALGVTASYVRGLAGAGILHPSVDDLARLRALGVTPAYIQRAAAHGFHNLTIEQLIRLKASDVL